MADQPNDKSQRDRGAGVEKNPEPAVESGPGQQRGADSDRDSPSPQSDKRVREAQKGPLPGQQICCALDHDAEIAASGGRRVKE